MFVSETQSQLSWMQADFTLSPLFISHHHPRMIWEEKGQNCCIRMQNPTVSVHDISVSNKKALPASQCIEIKAWLSVLWSQLHLVLLLYRLGGLIHTQLKGPLPTNLKPLCRLVLNR